MGKEWLMILMIALVANPVNRAAPLKAALLLASVDTPATSPTIQSNAGAPAAKVTPPVVQTKCDARPYKSLVGRTISDVLTIKLPPGTRIYRLGDPVTAPIPTGRLNIEINRGTRVGRIYCS